MLLKKTVATVIDSVADVAATTIDGAAVVVTLLAVAITAIGSVLLQQPLLSHVVLSGQRPVLLPRFTPLYHRSLFRSAAGVTATSAASTSYTDTTTALARAAACRFVTVVLNPAATVDPALPLLVARGDSCRRRPRR